MPLIKRSSKAARATNIRRLIDEGYPPRQAVAIGYSTQRAARARNRAGGSMGAKAHRDAAIEAEKATRAQSGAAAVASSQAASDHARAAEVAAKASDSRTDFRAAAQAHDAAASAAWLVGDSARSERHTNAMDRAWRAATRAVNAAGGRRSNRAGFSGEPYTIRNVLEEKGGPLLYVSRIGNRAAAYSPHDGFTVFGAMDGGELRVSYGKKGKHYSTPKTAEAAIRRWILEERREGANRAGRRSAADRLFIGVFPGGISYADRGRSEHGDYARVAFLPYDTLELKVSHGADPKLVKLASEHAKTIAAKRGQPFSISTAGQTVMLGSNRVGGKRRNRAGKVRPKDEHDARKIARDALQKAEKAIRSLRFDPESSLIAQEDRAVASFNRLRDRATDAAPYLPRDENDAITDALRNLRAMLDESIANASTVAKQAQSKIYAAADREASIERLARAFQRGGHSLADARKIARFRHENRAGGKRSVFAVVYAPATASRGPLYWSPEPGSYARRATGAWKTHDRAAAERFADQYGGTVVELPSRRR